ncbi:enoyl-CoA hydratase/isomerase family protein [Dietzia aurantiaca]|uniref:Enoyl-CoA hydratase/isomerase family protein n=1 Tax=Dietzia aurantiaca TaxID=983873 RepID=A0ABV9PNP4_9ACTN
MSLQVLDLDEAEPGAPGRVRFGEALLVCRASEPDSLARHPDLVESAAFTLVDAPVDDRRAVRVDNLDEACAAIAARVEASPEAARVCDDVLRANAAHGQVFPGLVTESLAYSTLQGGPEFAAWLRAQPPRHRHESADAVRVELDGPGTTLTIEFNRPDKHNAFSNALRAGLLDGLDVALASPGVTTCVLGGRGRSFCSGGDLREFGLFSNVAASHHARTRYSPAMSLDAVRRRLGGRFIAELHGAVMGSGLEMAAFCGTVRADSTTRFGLPELTLGLIPGAGGTVSVTRRIGRWRTAYLILSGEVIGTDVARGWGLVDEVVPGAVYGAAA